MKKYLFSSVMIAVSGLASAQSSVTLFGALDATLQKGMGSIADRTQLGSGGHTTSRVGLRGVEDLGGGLSAAFWLEGHVNVDNGTGATSSTNNQTTGAGPAAAGGQGFVFNRRSTVSLLGGFGEVRVGRDFTAHYNNRSDFDPYGNNGVGTSQIQVGSLGGPTNTRVSNAFTYFTPATLGGFYGVAQHYLGENASNAGATADDGTGSAFRLGYRVAPLHVSIAYGRTQYAQTVTTGDITTASAGARYDIGAFSLMGGYYRDRVETVTGLTGRGPQLGAIYRIGVGEVKFALSSYKTSAAGSPETKKAALGYVHNLSKRTAVYGTYARVSNSGGATTSLNGSSTGANRSSSGFDVGLRHVF